MTDYDEELENEMKRPAFGWIEGSIGCFLGMLIQSLPYDLVVALFLIGISLGVSAWNAHVNGVPFNHWWIFYW